MVSTTTKESDAWKIPQQKLASPFNGKVACVGYSHRITTAQLLLVCNNVALRDKKKPQASGIERVADSLAF